MTLTLPVLDPIQLPLLESWLRAILWDSILPLSSHQETTNIYDDDHHLYPHHHYNNDPFEIHRLKARVYLIDGSERIVQAVRDVFEIINLGARPPPLLSSEEVEVKKDGLGDDDDDDDDDDKDKIRVREGKMVLIGRHLLSSSSLSLSNVADAPDADTDADTDTDTDADADADADTDTDADAGDRRRSFNVWQESLLGHLSLSSS